MWTMGNRLSEISVTIKIKKISFIIFILLKYFRVIVFILYGILFTLLYSRILTESESCLVCSICHKRSVEKQLDCFEGLLKDKEDHIQMHPSCKNAEFISVYEKISSKESVKQNISAPGSPLTLIYPCRTLFCL